MIKKFTAAVFVIFVLLCSSCAYRPITVALAEEPSPEEKTENTNKLITPSPTSTASPEPTNTTTPTNTPLPTHTSTLEPTNTPLPTHTPPPTFTPIPVGKVIEISEPEKGHCTFEDLENFELTLGPGGTVQHIENMWKIEASLFGIEALIEEFPETNTVMISMGSTERENAEKTFAIKAAKGHVLLFQFYDTPAALIYGVKVYGEKGGILIPPRTETCTGTVESMTRFYSVITLEKDGTVHQSSFWTCEVIQSSTKPYLLPNGKYYTWEGCPILEIWKVTP